MCRRTSHIGCLLCSDSAPAWRRSDAHAASSSALTRFRRSRCWNRALYFAMICKGTRSGAELMYHIRRSLVTASHVS